MALTLQTVYAELADYQRGRPVVNTHCHQLPEQEYRSFDLDALLRNSYVNWCGVAWDSTSESRRRLLESVRFHAAFVWLHKSLQELYPDGEPLTATTWETWSARIGRAHQTPAHRQHILAEHCAYRRLILDAYWDPGSDNGAPAQFAPAFRVNAFHFGFSPQAFDLDGNNPYTLYPRPFIADLDEYVAWIGEHIARRKAQGCVALKIPLAYDRGLDIVEVSKEAAQRALARLSAAYADYRPPAAPAASSTVPSNAPDFTTAGVFAPGADPHDVKLFQDYIFFQICRLAAEAGLPVQVHTGTGQGRRANALQLQEVIEKNPATRFVLLHCSYPWIADMRVLVGRYANVFPDLSMVPLFSTQAGKAVLHELLEGATAEKLAWGCDTWTPEESYGSLLALRHVLAGVLAEKVTAGYFSYADACLVIDHVFTANPRALYGLA